MKKIIVTVLMLAFTIPALSRGRKGPMNTRQGMMMKRRAQMMKMKRHDCLARIHLCIKIAGVQLTTQQRDKIRTLKDQMKLIRDKNWPQVRDNMKALFKTFVDPSKTNDDVKAAFAKVLQAENTLSRKMLNKMLELRGILTKEQWSKILNTPQCFQNEGWYVTPYSLRVFIN